MYCWVGDAVRFSVLVIHFHAPHTRSQPPWLNAKLIIPSSVTTTRTLTNLSLSSLLNQRRKRNQSQERSVIDRLHKPRSHYPYIQKSKASIKYGGSDDEAGPKKPTKEKVKTAKVALTPPPTDRQLIRASKETQIRVQQLGWRRHCHPLHSRR
jgi:hypothetical protein